MGETEKPHSPSKAQAWNSPLFSLKVSCLLGGFLWQFCISGLMLLKPSASALPHQCQKPPLRLPGAFMKGCPKPFSQMGTGDTEKNQDLAWLEFYV